MSWRKIRAILRARPSYNFPDVQDVINENPAEDTTIPINVEEAKWHDSPSEPNLEVLSDGSHVYQIPNQNSVDFLSVPKDPYKLRRTSSLNSRPQFLSGRSPSLTSLNTLNGEGLKRSQSSLSGNQRSPKPVREIFYREFREEVCGPLELSSISQSGVDADGEKETLHSLARRGNTQEIRALLQQNEDIDKRDSYGKTPLHCAVSAGQISTVKYLLHCHANPNLKDHREEAPLHVAVRTGNIDVVEVLLNHKQTDVNVEGRNKYTPLHTAAYLEHRNALEICQRLLDCGADVTRRAIDHMTPLSVAAMKGAYDTMELFFKKCTEIKR